MSGRQAEDYDENTTMRHSCSQESGALLLNGSIPGMAKRHILAILSFFGFAIMYAMRVNLSIAVVAMTGNMTVHMNGTDVLMRSFDWSSETQGLVLSSFFYGYITTQLAGGWLANKFGGKYIFGGGILGTAVLTILTPPLARISVYALVAVRILEGMFQGVTYPCMHAMWAKWSPPLERGKLTTISFSGSYFGTVLALLLSGLLIVSLDWSWVFYIIGLLAILWFICWVWLVSESPSTHPTICHNELKYIQDSIGFTDSQVKDQAIPWKEILFSMPVWAIIMAHFAENWGLYTFLTELPTFLHTIYKYDFLQASLLSAIPYFVMGVNVQVGGRLADKLIKKEILSTTNTRKFLNVTGFIGQAVFMLAAAYATSGAIVLIYITFAVGCGGYAWSGFSVNHLDIAPQFASILLGISNTFATIPGIVSPLLTGHIVKDGEMGEWRVVFFLVAGINVCGAILYMLFASGERQSWADVPLSYSPSVERVSEYHEEVDEAEHQN